MTACAPQVWSSLICLKTDSHRFGKEKNPLSPPALKIQTSLRTFKRFDLFRRCFRSISQVAACLCLALWHFVLQVKAMVITVKQYKIPWLINIIFDIFSWFSPKCIVIFDSTKTRQKSALFPWTYQAIMKLKRYLILHQIKIYLGNCHSNFIFFLTDSFS